MFKLFFFRRMLHVCIIWMMHMFHAYIASVLFGCCVYFIWFSRVFQLFLQVFQMHVSVLSVFRRILSVLYLDVSKVDLVSCLAPSSPLTVSPRCLYLLSVPAGHLNHRRRRVPPLPLLLDAGRAAWDGGVAGTGHREWHGRTLLLFRGSVKRANMRSFCYAIMWFRS
jgi:hypothetical protein